MKIKKLFENRINGFKGNYPKYDSYEELLDDLVDIVKNYKVFCGGEYCSGLWNLQCSDPNHPKVEEQCKTHPRSFHKDLPNNVRCNHCKEERITFSEGLKIVNKIQKKLNNTHI